MTSTEIQEVDIARFLRGLSKRTTSETVLLITYNIHDWLERTIWRLKA